MAISPSKSCFLGFLPTKFPEYPLLTNQGPKTTTVCRPALQAVKGNFGAPSAHGYTFGRGGHERPYRPTVDSPFDVPSFKLRDGISVETFAKPAQLACQRRVVGLCFQGVPDMEYPSVGLEPGDDAVSEGQQPRLHGSGGHTVNTAMKRPRRNFPAGMSNPQDTAPTRRELC